VTQAELPERPEGPENGVQGREQAWIRPLAALMPFVLRYPGRFLLALLALLVAALATLAIPLAVRRMIDLGFAADAGGTIDQYFLAILGVVAILALASAARYYLVTTIGERVVADLRAAVFARIVSLDAGFFDRARAGEISSRLTADTVQIKSAVGSSASVALRNLLLLVGAIAMMVVTSPKLSLLVVIAIPAVMLPLFGFGRAVRRRSRIAQDKLAHATAFAVEAIGAVRTVQAMTAEEAARSRFGAAVEEAFDAAKDATRSRSFLTAIAIFLAFACVVLILWSGAQSVLAGQMTPGTLGQFVLYSVFAAGALGALAEVWGEVSQTAGAAERIIELLHTEPAIKAPAAPLPLPPKPRGEVRFEHVSYSYPSLRDAPVLDGVSFAAAPGERIAIVGPSGAGKSTIFHLLLRFDDPKAGSILFDGVDIAKADPKAVRRNIALVPQEPAIFAASIADNIRYGKPGAGEDEIKRAAETALVDEFVRNLPQGYDTPVGERGVTLSGGQRQRLAIARAVLRDAPVLLLDEATSALDAESEALVQKALERIMAGRTSLVIAHRLATVLGADRIVVLQKGRVVEEGSHAQLSASDGLYARLAALQFGNH
jgi:ATP-binding cassette subfamily B protein